MNRNTEQGIEYHKVHTWLHHKHKHKKKLCQFCESKDNLQFALKRGYEHKKSKKRYLILCKDCHWNYDLPNKCRKCGKRNKSKLNLCTYHELLELAKIRSLANICEKFCKKCGGKFITKIYGREQKFCSTTCRVYFFLKKRKMTAMEYRKSIG